MCYADYVEVQPCLKDELTDAEELFLDQNAKGGDCEYYCLSRAKTGLVD